MIFLLNGSTFAQVKVQPAPTMVAPVKVNTNATQFQSREMEYQQLQNDLKQLDIQKKQVMEQLKAYDEKQKEVLGRVQNLETFYNNLNPSGESTTQLLDATKNMQETQMSFNLQYLQLQNQMQNENRQFSMVSNIMKTKHDTVKNSISNIR
jgi:chromosome segregation ATPase